MNKYRVIFIAVLIFLFGYTSLWLLSLIINIEVTGTMNNIILFGTALAIIYYTSETEKLRKETVRQTELSICPCLAVYSVDNSSFKIRNVGNGSAINIKFEPLAYDDKLIFLIPDLLSLLPQETTALQISSKLFGTDITDSEINFLVHLGEEYGVKQYRFTAFFEDVSHQKYCQILELGKDGPYIGPVKREY